MATLVLKFLYRFAESCLQLADLAKDELRETQQNRRIDASFAEIVDDLFNVGCQILVFGGVDNEIAFSVDAKIIGSPIVDPVSFDALIYYCAQFVSLPDIVSEIAI